MSSLSGFSGTISETRKKQGKRDEALRKKIESELARKRTISSSHLQRGKRGTRPEVAKGTVAALRPSPALTVPENITVADASQLCAAKRTDCVLVVDEEEGLSGIFTAKDLAYRVTAEGLDPRATFVSQIMTRNPMVTRDTTSATEALQLMVTRHFRHLPVCNEEGNVVGLLDITKVFHEALGKVERSSSASEKLYAALAGVQSELGDGMVSNPQAAAAMAYVSALRDKTALPDLTTVMDTRTQPITVIPKTTVKEAAKLMKENRTTAVCVMEHIGPGVPPRIAGIFTSKDVVLRVIAAGLDPGRCSVVRVMTPHPDVGVPTMTVQDALKKMHNGHYLNLPVLEEDGRLVAIVDVLKLTYATLEQMNSMNADAADASGGPLWGRFFDSLGGHDDNESMVSGSHIPTDVATPASQPLSPFDSNLPGHSPEVHPNDSASVIDDDRLSNIDSSPVAARRGGGIHRQLSALSAGLVPALPVDDGTFVFKFRTPSGRTHRFQARNDSYEHIRDIVAGKLATDPFFTEFASKATEDDTSSPPDPTDFNISYTDADGDTVLITSDDDVTDSVKIARKVNSDRVVLVVQGGKAWGEFKANATASKEEVKEGEKAIVVEVIPPAATAPPMPVHAHIPPPPAPIPQDEVFGIPRDMVLPASIAALAVVVIGVFVASRLSK